MRRRNPTKKTVKLSNLKLPVEHLKKLAPYVKDIKCPDCKSFALYTEEQEGVPVMVRCHKCSYSLRLDDFALQLMGYQTENETATIRVPDLFGGDERVIEL